ncbi:PTH1 family peptidyl-tRNA hydrolase [Bradyrhizobium sp. F1.13.1]
MGSHPGAAGFRARPRKARSAPERVILLKPMTYMNESGRSVQEAASFFKIAPGDVTVFHDELELPPGKVRVKIGGGIAGHNGLRSISAHIGNDYRRVRLGIGHPGVKELVHGHVLSDFAKADNDWVATLCDAVAEHAALVAKGTDATFANRVHLAMQAKGFLTKDDNGKD